MVERADITDVDCHVAGQAVGRECLVHDHATAPAWWKVDERFVDELRSAYGLMINADPRKAALSSLLHGGRYLRKVFDQFPSQYWSIRPGEAYGESSA